MAAAWGKLPPLPCKRQEVGVVGTFYVQNYTGNDGQQRYSLEVTADEVEFLTPRGEQGDSQYNDIPAQQGNTGFVQVDDEDLPF